MGQYRRSLDLANLALLGGGSQGWERRAGECRVVIALWQLLDGPYMFFLDHDLGLFSTFRIPIEEGRSALPAFC